jgi:putative peptidoglycan lipid II flippase
MGVAAGTSRVIGFARVLAIAAILGTTYLGNTFTSSNYVSNVLFELLAAGALSAVLVPTLVDLLARPDEPEAERLAGSVLGIALIVLGAVTVVGVIAAPWLARLLSSGVDDPSIAAQQESLATFLLRFFVPQVLLYAIGTVAIAVLYAKRRFVVTAIAPIGHDPDRAGLVMFRVLTGGDTSLDLSLAELTLALSATLGVAAFVAVPSIALHRTGFRLRPRLSRGDPEVNRLLRLSGWAILQHAEIGLLLGAAIVLGNSVEGGTVAYQVAWVFFLAPYGVIAQPIHTAIHNELSLDAARADLAAFARSLRWALDAMAVLIVPVSAAMIALARPAMIVFAFGESAENGVNLLAAGLASLAIGLARTGSFSCSLGRTTRSATAGRRPSSPWPPGCSGSSRWVSACG